MTDRPNDRPNDLDIALVRIRSQIDWPQSHDLTAAVHTRIAFESKCGSRIANRPMFRRLGFGLAACVLVIAVALIATPGARTTIADRLGIPGITISTDDNQVASDTALALGERTDLGTVIDDLSYQPLLPPAALEGPDDVYLLRLPHGSQLSYVYRADDDTPGIAGTGVELLVSQFPGNTNESFIGKQLSDNTTIEMVAVGENAGFWIAGEAHVFYYEAPDGEIRKESIRLAANVLIWEHDDLTLRIESNLARDEAISAAESMAP